MNSLLPNNWCISLLPIFCFMHQLLEFFCPCFSSCIRKFCKYNEADIVYTSPNVFVYTNMMYTNAIWIYTVLFLKENYIQVGYFVYKWLLLWTSVTFGKTYVHVDATFMHTYKTFKFKCNRFVNKDETTKVGRKDEDWTERAIRTFFIRSKRKKTKAASEKQVKLTKNTKVIVESISSNKIWRLSSDQDHIRCCNGQQDS